VLDLLAIVSDYDLNFVGPLLNEYKLYKTKEVFLEKIHQNNIFLFYFRYFQVSSNNS